MFRYSVSAFTKIALIALTSLVLVGCVEQTPDLPSEEDVKAARENVLSVPPATMKYTINADLEDKVTYLGCDIDTDLIVPGKPFTLTHYWKVNQNISDDWRVFIHLESPDSKKNHLNADHTPVGGKYPVRVWKKGEIIRDIHKVSLPTNWPSNQMEMLVGLWKGNLRMKVVKGPADSENRVKVFTLPVAGAKEQEHRKILARKVKNGTIKLDGKLDESAWKEAQSTGAFVRTLDGLPADQNTTAKVLWDDKMLYVAFEMEDKDVWTTLTKHDDKLWTQEAVEMFIDADGDGKTYVELQANPKGITFDSYLPSYRKNENDWDSNMKAGVQVDGTVDIRTDQDKGWTVELGIPLEAAMGKEKAMKNVPPQVGTEWRVNFFRMDLPNGRQQSGTGWSPPMVGDFHSLDKFGTLVFANEKGVVPGAAVDAPSADKVPAKVATKGEIPSPDKAIGAALKAADKNAAPGAATSADATKAAPKVPVPLSRKPYGQKIAPPEEGH